MKFLKVIFLLILIVKSTMGFSIDVPFSGSCCPSESTEICVQDMDVEDEENKGCCDNSACDCLCCGHVFIYNDFSHSLKSDIHIYQENIIPYNNEYKFLTNLIVWHPPNG